MDFLSGAATEKFFQVPDRIEEMIKRQRARGEIIT
jgi:hypothetical protein